MKDGLERSERVCVSESRDAFSARIILVAYGIVLKGRVLTDGRLHHELEADGALKSARAIHMLIFHLGSLALQNGRQSHCIFGSKALVWTFSVLVIAVVPCVTRGHQEQRTVQRGAPTADIILLMELSASKSRT